MTQIRKHTFNTEFSPDGAIVRNAPKRLTSDQIAAECAAAYERGKRDAQTLSERQSAAALEALAAAATATLARLDVECRAMREEAAHLALIAARKIASAALDAFGAERAIAAIEAAMETLRHQPRLLIKLSPDTAESLKPRVAAIRDAHAYASAILVRDDASLDAGEVSIDWSDGVITMNSGEIAERISALIDAALANP